MYVWILFDKATSYGCASAIFRLGIGTERVKEERTLLTNSGCKVIIIILKMK